MDSAHDVKIERGTRGRLVRQMPMRLMDVSLSGCLVESDYDLGIGSTGMLLVDLWGVPCRYPVRVARVTERAGSGPCVLIAGEFAWNARPVSQTAAQAIAEGHAPSTGRVLKFEPRSPRR